MPQLAKDSFDEFSRDITQQYHQLIANNWNLESAFFESIDIESSSAPALLHMEVDFDVGELSKSQANDFIKSYGPSLAYDVAAKIDLKSVAVKHITPSAERITQYKAKHSKSLFASHEVKQWQNAIFYTEQQEIPTEFDRLVRWKFSGEMTRVQATVDPRIEVIGGEKLQFLVVPDIEAMRQPTTPHSGHQLPQKVLIAEESMAKFDQYVADQLKALKARLNALSTYPSKKQLLGVLPTCLPVYSVFQLMQKQRTDTPDYCVPKLISCACFEQVMEMAREIYRKLERIEQSEALESNTADTLVNKPKPSPSFAKSMDNQLSEKRQVLIAYAVAIGLIGFSVVSLALSACFMVGFYGYIGRLTTRSKEFKLKKHLENLQTQSGALLVTGVAPYYLARLFGYWESGFSLLLQFVLYVGAFLFTCTLVLQIFQGMFRAYNNTAHDQKVELNGSYQDHLTTDSRAKKLQWLKVIIVIDVLYLLFEIIFNANIAGVSSGLVLSQETFDDVEFFGRTLSGVGLGLMIASLAIPVQLELGKKFSRLALILICSVPAAHIIQNFLVELVVQGNKDKANLAHLMIEQRDFAIQFPERYIPLKEINQSRDYNHEMDTLTYLAFQPFARMGFKPEAEAYVRKQKSLHWVDDLTRARFKQNEQQMYQALNDYLKLVEFNVAVHNDMLRYKLPSFNHALELRLVFEGLKEAERTFYNGGYQSLEYQVEQAAQKRYQKSRVRKKNLRDNYATYRWSKKKGRLKSRGIYGLEYLKRSNGINLNWIFTQDPKRLTYFNTAPFLGMCDSDNYCPGDEDWDYTIALKHIEKVSRSDRAKWGESYAHQKTGFPYGLGSPRDLSRYPKFIYRVEGLITQGLGFEPLVPLSDIMNYQEQMISFNDILSEYRNPKRKQSTSESKKRLAALNGQTVIFRSDPSGRKLPFNNAMFRKQVTTQKVLKLAAVQNTIKKIMGDYYAPIYTTKLTETQFKRLVESKMKSVVKRKVSHFAYSKSLSNEERAERYLKAAYVPPIALGFSLVFIFVTLVRVAGYPFELKAIAQNQKLHVVKSRYLKIGLVSSIVVLFIAIGMSKDYSRNLMKGSSYFSGLSSKFVGYWIVGAQSTMLKVSHPFMQSSLADMYDHPSMKNR